MKEIEEIKEIVREKIVYLEKFLKNSRDIKESDNYFEGALYENKLFLALLENKFKK